MPLNIRAESEVGIEGFPLLFSSHVLRPGWPLKLVFPNLTRFVS